MLLHQEKNPHYLVRLIISTLTVEPTKNPQSLIHPTMCFETILIIEHEFRTNQTTFGTSCKLDMVSSVKEVERNVMTPQSLRLDQVGKLLDQNLLVSNLKFEGN